MSKLSGKIWCVLGNQEKCVYGKYCVRDGKVCIHLLVGFEEVEPKSEVEDVEASLKQIAEGKSKKSKNVNEFLRELKGEAKPPMKTNIIHYTTFVHNKPHYTCNQAVQGTITKMTVVPHEVTCKNCQSILKGEEKK